MPRSQQGIRPGRASGFTTFYGEFMASAIGMYPASLSRLVEGQNASMVLVTDVSTVQNTSDISRNLDVHRMEVRECVSHQNQVKHQRHTYEGSDSVTR